MQRKFVILLASGFGLGRLPVAPGTFGCLLGLPLAWALSGLPLPLHVAAAVLLALLAVPICTAGEKTAGEKDPSWVVADEYLTLPICLLGLPFTPWTALFAFAGHRLFDIWKPCPIHQLQKLPAGWGIVLDDVLAALYALGLLWLLRAAGLPLLKP